MIDRHIVSVLLNTAFTGSNPPPEPAKTVAEATKRVNEEARLLVEEVRGLSQPLHETLAEIAERMG